MTLRAFAVSLGLLLIAPAWADGATAARSMERLNRGLVAVHLEGSGVYLGWRLLGTDPKSVGFDVHRDGKKITAAPIRESTNFLDAGGSHTSRYSVRAVTGGSPLPASRVVTPLAQQYMEIPLDVPPPFQIPRGEKTTYKPWEGSVADLDGDGEYELVLTWSGIGKDVSQNGYTTPTIMDGIETSGKRLWRINLGINIRSGAHYAPFLVYDLDGDGKAEVVCRTSDGTTDGAGKVLGDDRKDWRDRNGRVLRAPERLTAFNGETGAAIDTVGYEPERGSVQSWGDSYGNRCERHLACIAYLDGQKPSVVMGRGYYRAKPGRTAIAAWDLENGKLTLRWKFDTYNKKSLDGYIGQGTHSIAVGDIDDDGKDEIIYGAMAVDDDGSPLYTTRLEHGDAHHFSDLDPSHPGLEFFMPHEKASAGGIPGMSFRDARTGKILWSIPVTSKKADIGRGACGDIYAGSPGAEAWVAGANNFDAKYAGKLFSCKGEVIGPAPDTPANFFVWWDDDLTREILNKSYIAKYDPKAEGAMRRILTAEGSTSVNGTKATPVLSADIFGDWREEVIWARDDGRALRMYTTTIPTSHRITTLMHDPIYRLSVAWQNVAYNQPPHPGFTLEDLERRSNE